MSDLISREDATKAVYDLSDKLANEMLFVDAVIDMLENLPSSEPELDDFEWCHDCKEYDQEKHCCHRWTKVIRNTVEEIKTKYWRWIPVTEALPEEEEVVLVTAHYDGDKYYMYKPNDYVSTAEYIDGRWRFSDEEFIMQLHKHHVIAWMPLPEPWEGDR